MPGITGFNHSSEGLDFRGKRLIGKVVDNNDPNKCFRLKIAIPEVYGDAPKEDLPWCIPDKQSLMGNTSGCGTFGVPIIGSILYVELQEGDPAFPVYGGSPVTPSTKKALMDENYPHRYGFVDEKGNHGYVDRQTHDMEFKHKSGTKIHIDPDGTIRITGVKDEFIDITGNVNLKVGGNVDANITGNVTAKIGGNLDCQATGTGLLKSGGALTLQGSTVTIIGSTITLQGTVIGTSTATFTGTVIGQGVNLKTHTHTAVSSGSSTSGPPA